MTRAVHLVVLILSLVFYDTGNAARILASFPFPAISHQVVFRPLVQELAKRGHEVVVITTDPVFEKGKTPANLTEIDVHDISYELWRQIFLKTLSGNDHFQAIKMAVSTCSKVFGVQMETDEVQKILKDKTQKFDLILAEAMVKPTLVLSHVFNAPIIQVSSMGAILSNFAIVGAPDHPLLYPAPSRHRVYNLTVWEKLRELYFTYKYYKFDLDLEYEDDKMLKRIFGPNTPDLSELRNNVDMLLLNVNSIWEGNRPVPPNVVFLGGLHQKQRKDLPKDLQKYLDDSKHGVIYISFGTNINPSQLSPEKIQALINALSKLKYDVLWKWDKDVLPGKSDNIKIFKWLPQSDLLHHPKVKLFITQGGLQSTDEALTAGVPLLGIPLAADQWYNVEKYRHHNIGNYLYLESVTEEEFSDAITTIINDESYRKNAVHLRNLMRDQPNTPLERAVWSVEYVLRHGGAKHLRSPGANISWCKYLELELVGYVLLSALFVIAVLRASISYLVKTAKSALKGGKVKSN